MKSGRLKLKIEADTGIRGESQDADTSVGVRHKSRRSCPNA